MGAKIDRLNKQVHAYDQKSQLFNYNHVEMKSRIG